MKDIAISKLPKLTNNNLESIMEERMAASKNQVTSIPMLWQGLVEMELQVGNQSRTAKLYVPENTPQGTSFVMLNIPHGERTIDFLQKSGWLELADRNSVCLFAAEPGENGWQRPEAEQAYIYACIQAMFDGIYLRGGMSAYIVGYGEIGTCLHKEVLCKPLKIAAASFVNASEVDTPYLQEIESIFTDAEGTPLDISLKDIPVPVWILQNQMTKKANAVASHWIDAMGNGGMKEDPTLGTVFTQGKDFVGTPGGKIVQVAIKETDIEYCDPELAAAICHFLTGYVRFTRTSPYGSTLTKCVDYKAMGVQLRYFPDENGEPRECLIYVPKEFRDGRKLPLVFAIHGSGASVRNFFELTMWYRKAQQEGFMVVMPETTLYPMPDLLSGGIPKAYRTRWKNLTNVPEEKDGAKDKDLQFFSRILDALIEEYPVDKARIYCTGQSNGCMLTSFIGSSPLASRFAALAATSGVTMTWDSSGTETIPIWMNMGEFDLWDYRLEEDTQQTAAIDKWLVRNKIASEETAKQIRICGASLIFQEERHHAAIWNNQQGIPMVRYDWVEKKDHMNTPEENEKFWDQWFCKWTLAEDGRRYYEGKPVFRQNTQIQHPGDTR